MPPLYCQKRHCLGAAFGIAVMLAGLSGPPAIAEEATRVPESRRDLKLSFAPVVKKVAPAVVNVYATHVEKSRTSPFWDDPFFRRFFGEHGFGAPRERVQKSLGSGVIVSPSGIVITNHHVIKNATAVKVVLHDRREFEADIILRDKRTDLAVLKLRGGEEEFPSVPFGDSDALEVGDLVLAIGNPFGIGQTVTSGIVSALARTQVGVSDYQFFIQTDAAINPGNSGGALVDLDGRLVGINTAIYSRSGGSMGIGFAIPSNMVRVVAESAADGGVLKRPWLGARLQSVTSEIAASLALKKPTGAIVASVREKGPAAEAGLEPGDVILAIDGQEVTDANAFGYRLATKDLGSKASLKVVQDGSEETLELAVVAAPEDPPRDRRRLTGNNPFAGSAVVNISPAVAEELSIRIEEGVAIAEVSEDSLARELGLKKGDIVLTVNGREVRNTRELERIVRQPARFWRFSIQRGDEIFQRMIR